MRCFVKGYLVPGGREQEKMVPPDSAKMVRWQRPRFHSRPGQSLTLPHVDDTRCEYRDETFALAIMAQQCAGTSAARYEDDSKPAKVASFGRRTRSRFERTKSSPRHRRVLATQSEQPACRVMVDSAKQHANGGCRNVVCLGRDRQYPRLPALASLHRQGVVFPALPADCRDYRHCQA